MPRAFTEADRNRIDARLREEAAERFMSTGCRKTTVDELAAGAGISKGAFYLFYASKEALFYRVIMDYHFTVRESLLARIDAVDNPGPEDLANAFTEIFRAVGASFLPTALRNGELDYLTDRLDPETLAGHYDDDSGFFAAVLARIPGYAVSDIPFWAAAFRGLFALLLHRHDIGDAFYDRVIATLVRQTVLAMTASSRTGPEQGATR